MRALPVSSSWCPSSFLQGLEASVLSAAAQKEEGMDLVAGWVKPRLGSLASHTRVSGIESCLLFQISFLQMGTLRDSS